MMNFQFPSPKTNASEAYNQTAQIVLVVAALASAVFYAVLYYQDPQPAIAIQGILWIITLILTLVLRSGALVQRIGSENARRIVLAGFVLPFITNILIWEISVATVFLVGAVVATLIGRWLLKLSGWDLFATVLFYLIASAIANALPTGPRQPMDLSLMLQAFFPMLAIGLILLVFGFLGRLFASGSIRTRLLIAFVLMALLPVAVSGVITTFYSVTSTRNRLAQQLDSIVALKETQIQSWTDTLQNNLNSVFNSEDLIRLATVLEPGEGVWGVVLEFNRDKLHDQMQKVMSSTLLFKEIFFMDLQGVVVLSTDPSRIDHSYAGHIIFAMGQNEPFVATPSNVYSRDTESFMVAQPVFDDKGKKLGVIAGRAKLDALNSIMTNRTGLGETGETYLVGVTNLGLTPMIHEQPSDYLSSKAIDTAISTKTNGSDTYVNPLGVEVVGVYHWMDDLDTVLVAEQSTEEVRNETSLTMYINLGVILAAAIMAITAALLVARSIARPIESLASVSSRLAAGEMGLSANVERNDEIGALARAFNAMSGQVLELISNLEKRVTERTNDLQRRTDQLQIAAEVARDINSATGLDDLLSQAVNLIRTRFGFYHAGIFLIDERGEYAVLRAATGEAGRQMLEQRHRLKVGEVGIVGAATGLGKPRIALDVGADAAHFKNPFLPKTRSELALPLSVGKRVIGALDVQSTEESAFDEQDITVLQTMADQLAVAIENARLIEKMNLTVQELEQAYGQYTQQAWRNFMLNQRSLKGYRFQDIGVYSVEEKQPEVDIALDKNETININGRQLSLSDRTELHLHEHHSALAVPIKLRNQTIGVLNMRFEMDEIPSSTILLIEEAAARLALVLENARLLQDAQRLANREKQINLLANEVRGSVNLDAILQTTVRELGKTLGASRAYIQVGATLSEEEPDSLPRMISDS